MYKEQLYRNSPI